jgi:excisionase family DNA binding protein
MAVMAGKAERPKKPKTLAEVKAAKDWRERVTVRVPECAEILDISRTTAYDAARAGDIPTVKIGGRLLVPVAGLKKKLGL